jgi:hypothetical protein
VSVPADRDEIPVREFGSWTADLRKIVQWHSTSSQTSSSPSGRSSGS